MRSWIAGRRRARHKAPEAAPGPTSADRSPLTAVRVSTSNRGQAQTFGRRDIDFAFDHVFIPSLIIDHTELVLRQAGVFGEEGFVVWAGTLSGGHAHVSSVVLPKMGATASHGEISAETTAHLLESLDHRDLVPIVQMHSHPREAFLSETDAIRPLVAVPGFLSIIVPSFGFVDVADVGLWSAHEFRGRDWRELDAEERSRRFIVDDSLIRVD